MFETSINRVYMTDVLQEMEQERLAHESEEKERAERMKKIKEQFTDPNTQWEKDKSDIKNLALEEKAKDPVAGANVVKAPGSGSPVQVEVPVAEKKAEGKAAVSQQT